MTDFSEIDVTMSTVLVLPFVKKDDGLDGRIKAKYLEIGQSYFEPLRFKNERKIIEFLEDNRENFMEDSGEFARLIIDKVGVEKILNMRDTMRFWAEDLLLRYPEQIAQPLSEALELEVDDELQLLKFATDEKNALVMKTTMTKDFMKVIANTVYTISALSYFGIICPVGSFTKDSSLFTTGLILAKLALDYAEEQDAFIETILMSLNPKEKQEFVESLKERGKIIKTKGELEAWAQSH